MAGSRRSGRRLGRGPAGLRPGAGRDSVRVRLSGLTATSDLPFKLLMKVERQARDNPVKCQNRFNHK